MDEVRGWIGDSLWNIFSFNQTYTRIFHHVYDIHGIVWTCAFQLLPFFQLGEWWPSSGLLRPRGSLRQTQGGWAQSLDSSTVWRMTAGQFLTLWLQTCITDDSWSLTLVMTLESLFCSACLKRTPGKRMKTQDLPSFLLWMAVQPKEMVTRNAWKLLIVLAINDSPSWYVFSVCLHSTKPHASDTDCFFWHGFRYFLRRDERRVTQSLFPGHTSKKQVRVDP